jgi:hypothetical protein
LNGLGKRGVKAIYALQHDLGTASSATFVKAEVE